MNKSACVRKPAPPAEPLGWMSRRSWMKAAAAGTAAWAGSGGATQAAETDVAPDYRIRQGRIRQSIMGWTYNPTPVPELARHCRDIGLVAMEGIAPEHYPAIRELGLAVSLVGSHGFAQGPFQPMNR